jgi:SPP1 gp7 family putative phage head morphogenesis protein
MPEFGEHENGLWLPWGVVDDMEPDLAAWVKGVETAHPVATERLRQYWTHGPGAAKIRWGEPGDFKRCVRQVEKYMPGRAEGYCANRHKEALGVWPGREHGKKDDEPDVIYDEHHPDVIAVFDVEQAAYDAWGKSLSPEEIVETKALNIPGIFDIAGWIRALAKDARDVLTRVYVDAATKELARLRDQALKIEGAGKTPPTPADDIVDLDVDLPDVASAITEQVNRIANVDEATYARIADTLADGEAKGETMPQLSDRVRAVFETSKMRAMRIARTEVTAGANSAQMLAAQHNGAITKTWLSIRDPRTREEHRLMDHKTIKIDDHFSVPLIEGGVPVAIVPMEYPGDPAAPPSLTVNCRCTMIYGYGIDYPGAPESAEWFGR